MNPGRKQGLYRLLDKIGEAMSEDFDFTEKVRGLQMPTLIVAADADMAPPSHYVEVFNLLDGGLRGPIRWSRGCISAVGRALRQVWARYGR